MPKTSPLRSRLVSLKKDNGVYQITVRVWEFPNTETSDSAVDFTFRSHSIKALWWRLRLQSAVSPSGQSAKYTNAQYNRALRVATESMNQDIFSEADEQERRALSSQTPAEQTEERRELRPAPTPVSASASRPSSPSKGAQKKTTGKGKAMRKNPNGGHRSIAISYGSIPDVHSLREQMTAVTGDDTFRFDQMTEEDMQRLGAVASPGVMISGNALVTKNAEQLHEILDGLTELWEDGDDRAGDLAASVLEVCGFLWV